ncbi:MAG: hypothetical protein LAN70_01690 [Acidobacteriia bacterium]|nr:hypothetical protein [Terriglobia bacterium]
MPETILPSRWFRSADAGRTPVERGVVLLLAALSKCPEKMQVSGTGNFIIAVEKCAKPAEIHSFRVRLVNGP